MRDGERTQYCAEICAFKTVASQRQLWAPALSHYPPIFHPRKSVCPLMDRQMNNPVGGNIIIDVLTFTWLCSPTRGGGGKKKAKNALCIETSRHLICRQIPKTPSKTIVFLRRNTGVGWEMRGRDVWMTGRRSSDPLSGLFQATCRVLRTVTPAGGSKLAAVALFSWAYAYLAGGFFYVRHAVVGVGREAVCSLRKVVFWMIWFERRSRDFYKHINFCHCFSEHSSCLF